MQPLKHLYKKMDRCIRLLEELNSQMRDLRKQTAEAKVVENRENEANQTAVGETSAIKAYDSIAAAAISDAAAVCREEDSTETQPDECTEKRGFNVDKLGRVYTEEEIRKLIAD